MGAKTPRLSQRQIAILQRVADGMLCWECAGRRDWRTVASLFRRGLITGNDCDGLLTDITVTAAGRLVLHKTPLPPEMTVIKLSSGR
jgi:hypothetical protein